MLTLLSLVAWRLSLWQSWHSENSILGFHGRYMSSSARSKILQAPLEYYCRGGFQQTIWSQFRGLKFVSQHGTEDAITFNMTYQETHRQVSDIRRTLVGNSIVDHSDVVGASPVGDAPTTSSFSINTWLSMYFTKATASRDEKHFSFGVWCTLY